MKPTKTRNTLGRAGRRAVSLVLALLLCLPAYAFAATGTEDQRPAAASVGASEPDPAKDDGANADDQEKPDVSEAMDLFDAIDAFLATSAFEALAVDVRSGFRDLVAASRAAVESAATQEAVESECRRVGDALGKLGFEFRDKEDPAPGGPRMEVVAVDPPEGDGSGELKIGGATLMAEAPGPEARAANDEGGNPTSGVIASARAGMSYSWRYGTDWVGYLPYGSAERYTASDGNVAYCLHNGLSMPHDQLWGSYTPTPQIKAVMAYGYPNTTNIGGYSLSADQAQCATQLCVWAWNTSGRGTRVNLADLYSISGAGGDAVLGAARWLYDKAAGGFSNWDVAEIAEPANKTAQPFNGDYVRFGSYLVSMATSANIYLNTAPAGSFLGDEWGNQLPSPGIGSPFWIYVPRAALESSGSTTVYIDAYYKSQTWICWSANNPGSQQDMLNASDPFDAVAYKDLNITWSTSKVTKTDAETGEPIAGTRFSLCKQNASGGWDQLYEGETDGSGELLFGGLGEGWYKVVELSPSDGYMTPGQAGTPVEKTFYVGTEAGSHSVSFDDYKLRHLNAAKADAETGEPVPDTTIAIYSYPVEVEDGLVVTDVSGVAEDDPEWVRLDSGTTPADGMVDFGDNPFGYYMAVEEGTNPDYQTPSQQGTPRAKFIMVDKHTKDLTFEFENFKLRPIDVAKEDKDTHEPVADTDFDFFCYPVTIKDGLIVDDVSDIAHDDPSWVKFDAATTDEDGKIRVPKNAFGYYMIRETRPNPLYGSSEENGEPSYHMFAITKETTDEVQVFGNEFIRLSCEVYKETIALTSSALDATYHGFFNNTGREEYLYNFGARSTSNVKADEFWVEDPLEIVDLGYRLDYIVTGTAPKGADFDDRFTLLFQTNLNDKSAPTELSKGLMSPLYDNPNNPDGNLQYLEDGWLEWKAGVSTQTPEKLFVKDLGLQEGEYVTAIAMAYGDVDKGFFTGSKWAMIPSDQWYNEKYAGKRCRDFYYGVKATESLEPVGGTGEETVIRNTVKAKISRNDGVLRDDDRDEVETRVIDSFSTGYKYGRSNGLTRTGDAVSLATAAALAAIAAGGGVAAWASKRRATKRRGDRG